MKLLQIATDLTLPLDVVTEKLSFLGRTGSGKTYAAMKLAELMLDAGAQIVALDPVGVWYGLRIGGSWNVYIFGGLHGDYPLESTSGALIADLIIDRGICAVLDVSQFTSGEQIRFVTDFANRFFQRKKSAPSAVHLFLEECQEFVPQNLSGTDKQGAFMLHAFERLWKLGRNFGIGGSLISQRPQEVNKKALNQAGTLFVFNMTGPQERKAIESWVADKGINDDIAAVLPYLKVGEPHVWSPTFKISKTVRIIEKRTADVSTTPKVGSRSHERPLTPIDVEKLKTDMAATVERTKAENPAELRRQIADLQRKIKELEARKPEASKPIEVSILTEEDRLILNELFSVAKVISVDLEVMRDFANRIGLICDKALKIQAPALAKSGNKITEKRQTPRQVAHSENPHELTRPEQRILDAIAWLESIGVDTPEQPAVAFLAGYTYGSGGYNNPRGALRTKGLVEYVPGDKLRLTAEGRGLVNTPDTPLSTTELHRAVLGRLPKPEQRILSVILKAYPNNISNDECADTAGYARGSGGYNNPRGRLRTLGLIEYPGNSTVRARDILFID